MHLGQLARMMRGVRQTSPGMPAVISFLVTGRCCLRCRHCFFHEQIDSLSAGIEELRLEEYERLSRGMGDFSLALFCGGEPFMRPDLGEIVTLFQKNNGLLLASACTNGQLTASVLRQAEAILEARRRKLFCLAISIDGFRETHDVIRGEGTYDRALRTWRECRTLARHHPNLILAVTTVVSSLNQAEAPRFVSHVARSLRPDLTNVLLARQSPRGGDALKLVEPERYRAAQNAALDAVAVRSRLGRFDPRALSQRSLARGVHRTMLTGRRSFRCRAGRRGAVIDPGGNVNICEVLAEDPDSARIGNLRDWNMDFRALWRCSEARRLRRLVHNHPACSACTHETMGYLPAMTASPRRFLPWT